VILDTCTQHALYAPLHPRLAQALAAMLDRDWRTIPAGTIELDGERLFAMVNHYTTREASQCRFEAHRRYVDLQFLVAGTEQIEVADIRSLESVVPYDPASDVAFFQGSGDRFVLTPGRFAIFFPHDAHRPGIAVAEPGAVQKVVIKVALSS
jgi:YhcH/YjgK/YiaL family protein